MDPIFTEEQTEQDEQGGYALAGKDHAGSLSETGSGLTEAERYLTKTGNKDPAPGRENKGTGIPERDALGPSDPCPEKTVLALPAKNTRTDIPR